ncbi:MAG: zinc-binding dehydrogenase [Actinomycetia bacterium]|nr:zinc-binding dehydrogenase [Actinomycetes bacterium]
MKAVRFHEHGGRDVLRYEDVEDPIAGEGEVVVRVRACGLNHFDVDLRENASRWPLPLPWTLGVEFAGEIAALGPGVSGVSAGDRVWALHEIPCLKCTYCIAGMDNICESARMYSVQTPGGYAELVAAPASGVFSLPETVSFDTAAAGQIVFTTAWHMLVNRGEVKPGETVLISAAGSGVGHAAIQIAKLAGATVITTGGSDEKLAAARADGADHVINYRAEDVTERALALNGGPVDLVIEHVGGEQFGACLAALRKDGRLITCGAHAGEVVDFDIIPVFRNEWRVIGSRTGTTAETRLVMDLIADGKLRPRVHRSLPLAEAAEAMRIIEDREHFGKVIVNP